MWRHRCSDADKEARWQNLVRTGEEWDSVRYVYGDTVALFFEVVGAEIN